VHNHVFDITITKQSPRQHVYTDLQPYMCLWEDCFLGRRMYSTRHEWLQHEQNYHGKAWTCRLGCSDPFSDRQSIQDHYLSDHSAQTQYQMEKVLQASEISRSDTEPYTCPLCSTMVSATKAYAKHAGRHLRELSLFALPAYATDEVLADDDSEDKSGRESVIIDKPNDIASEGSDSSDGAGNDVEDGEYNPYTNSSPALDDTNGGEELLTIKCSCGISDNSGDTDLCLCEKCHTWQHIACYYESNRYVPEVHECIDCTPRIVDRKKVAEKAMQRRQVPSVGNRKGKTIEHKTDSYVLTNQYDEIWHCNECDADNNDWLSFCPVCGVGKPHFPSE
jgi:rubrerythrin